MGVPIHDDRYLCEHPNRRSLRSVCSFLFYSLLFYSCLLLFYKTLLFYSSVSSCFFFIKPSFFFIQMQVAQPTDCLWAHPLFIYLFIIFPFQNRHSLSQKTYARDGTHDANHDTQRTSAKRSKRSFIATIPPHRHTRYLVLYSVSCRLPSSLLLARVCFTPVTKKHISQILHRQR